MVTDEYFEAGFIVVLQDVVAGPVLTDYVDMVRSRPLLVVALVARVDVLGARDAARLKTGYDDGWSVEEFLAGFHATTPSWVCGSTRRNRQWIRVKRELELADRIADQASLAPGHPLARAAARHGLGRGPSPYEQPHQPEPQRFAPASASAITAPIATGRVE